MPVLQVLDACRVLSGMALRVLVVSPFLRCLQTAAIVKQAMDGSFDQTHVDCKLCEVCQLCTVCHYTHIKVLTSPLSEADVDTT